MLRMMHAVPTCTPSAPCDVVVDQDCGEAADTNNLAVLALLQSPAVNVRGVTIVYGDYWQASNFAHCFRLVELMQFHDVPVLWGATEPIVRRQDELRLWELEYGTVAWKGMWTPNATGFQNYGPGVLLPPTSKGHGAMWEGCSDALSSAACDCTHQRCSVGERQNEAAKFLVDMAKLHNDLIVVALGPMTNIAVARMLDPAFVVHAHLWAMAGSFNPPRSNFEHADMPRLSTNLWFDPVGSRRALRSDSAGHAWRSVAMVSVDASYGAPWIPSFVQRVASLPTRAAQYVNECRSPEANYSMVDEITVAMLINRSLGKAVPMYVDVVLDGASSGDTLSWQVGRTHPGHGEPLAQVYVSADVAGFYDFFVDMLKVGPAKAEPICTRSAMV